MSKWTFKTLIIPAQIAPLCRSLASAFPGGAGMWEQGLSKTGKSPATHYISSGKIWEQFASLLSSSSELALGAKISAEQAEMLLSASDVSSDPAHVAIARMGLTIIEAADD